MVCQLASFQQGLDTILIHTRGAQQLFSLFLVTLSPSQNQFHRNGGCNRKGRHAYCGAVCLCRNDNILPLSDFLI